MDFHICHLFYRLNFSQIRFRPQIFGQPATPIPLVLDSDFGKYPEYFLVPSSCLFSLIPLSFFFAVFFGLELLVTSSGSNDVSNDAVFLTSFLPLCPLLWIISMLLEQL